MIKVLFVCHGNICRSTLVQSVFTHKVASQGLSAHFLIDSAATSTEEIGNPPHRGTVNKLRKIGIPLVPHRARQVTWADYEKFDYIIGMDGANIRNLNRMLKGDPEGKIYKFLTFAGSDRDIADPWYTGDLTRRMKMFWRAVWVSGISERTGTDITKSLMSIHFRLRWKERTVSAAIYQCAGGTSGRFVD